MKHFITIPGLCLMLVACRDDWKTIEAYALPAKDACSEKILIAKPGVGIKSSDGERKNISAQPMRDKVVGSRDSETKENGMKKVEQFVWNDRYVPPRFNTEVDTVPEVKAETCVDINNANAEDLKKLRGVGDAKAAQIIKFRTKRPFRHKKDIMKIKGIGRKSFLKMADTICDIRPNDRKEKIKGD